MSLVVFTIHGQCHVISIQPPRHLHELHADYTRRVQALIAPYITKPEIEARGSDWSAFTEQGAFVSLIHTQNDYASYGLHVLNGFVGVINGPVVFHFSSANSESYFRLITWVRLRFQSSDILYQKIFL